MFPNVLRGLILSELVTLLFITIESQTQRVILDQWVSFGFMVYYQTVNGNQNI